MNKIPSEPGHTRIVFWVGYYSFSRPWAQQSTWYRVLGPGQALKAGGVTIDFLALEQSAGLQAILERGDVQALILHRIPFLPDVERILCLARAKQIPLFFDIDDNIVQVEGLISATSVRGKRAVTQEEKTWVELYRKTLTFADRTLCATERLREVVNDLKPGAAVLWPNYLPDFYLSRRGPAFVSASSRFRVFYGPGSAEHQFHLSLIEEALVAFLRSHPESEFVLGGGLEPSRRLHQVRDRVFCLPKLPPASYLACLGDMDLVLAPLRQTPFSWCKSWIKALEAAAQGTPWLASPLPDYRKFHEKTGTGTLVSDEDWEHAFQQAYAQRESLRQQAASQKQAIRRAFSWPERRAEFLEAAIHLTR